MVPLLRKAAISAVEIFRSGIKPTRMLIKMFVFFGPGFKSMTLAPISFGLERKV
jgi:hypothetical protein